jgi:hypothetical protein
MLAFGYKAQVDTCAIFSLIIFLKTAFRRTPKSIDKQLNRIISKPETFERLFEVAEIAKFSKEEAEAYEDSLKSYRDLKNSLDTAFEEGIEKGIEKVAIGLIKENISDKVIISTTGLTQEQLAHLKGKLKNQ